MSARITVKEFSAEGADLRTVAAAVARHFGTIADGQVQDSGLAIAHTVEYTDEEPGQPGEGEGDA